MLVPSVQVTSSADGARQTTGRKRRHPRQRRQRQQRQRRRPSSITKKRGIHRKERRRRRRQQQQQRLKRPYRSIATTLSASKSRAPVRATRSSARSANPQLASHLIRCLSLLDEEALVPAVAKGSSSLELDTIDDDDEEKGAQNVFLLPFFAPQINDRFFYCDRLGRGVPSSWERRAYRSCSSCWRADTFAIPTGSFWHGIGRVSR